MKLRAILCSECGRPCLSWCVACGKRAVRFQVKISHGHSPCASLVVHLPLGPFLLLLLYCTGRGVQDGRNAEIWIKAHVLS